MFVLGINPHKTASLAKSMDSFYYNEITQSVDTDTRGGGVGRGPGISHLIVSVFSLK